ncbi:MAG: TetR family transcriptional regulator [Candidatus Midichloriaceae bacterium]|jgi:AcrR family transcriptional regulator|nr:TetR family transcriptional regulator [Candidatus Midichloriaceae bacterium]
MGRRGDHTFKELSNMILDSASNILINEGFQKITTRKIATQIEYSVGTLYNIFQNLDDIYIHLNGRTLDDLIKILEEAIKESNGSQLRALAYAYVKFSINHVNAWSLLCEYRFPESVAIPKWYEEKIEYLYEIAEKALNNILNIDNPQHLKKYITVLWAGIHGICALSSKGKFTRTGLIETESQHLVDTFLDNYINGIKLTRV